MGNCCTKSARVEPDLDRSPRSTRRSRGFRPFTFRRRHWEPDAQVPSKSHIFGCTSSDRSIKSPIWGQSSQLLSQRSRSGESFVEVQEQCTEIFDLQSHKKDAELSESVKTSLKELSVGVTNSVSELSANIDRSVSELTNNVERSISELFLVVDICNKSAAEQPQHPIRQKCAIDTDTDNIKAGPSKVRSKDDHRIVPVHAFGRSMECSCRRITTRILRCCCILIPINCKIVGKNTITPRNSLAVEPALMVNGFMNKEDYQVAPVYASPKDCFRLYTYIKMLTSLCSNLPNDNIQTDILSAYGDEETFDFASISDIRMDNSDTKDNPIVSPATFRIKTGILKVRSNTQTEIVSKTPRRKVTFNLPDSYDSTDSESKCESLDAIAEVIETEDKDDILDNVSDCTLDDVSDSLNDISDIEAFEAVTFSPDKSGSECSAAISDFTETQNTVGTHYNVNDYTLDDVSDSLEDVSDNKAFDKTEAVAPSLDWSESDLTNAIAEVIETQDIDDSLDGASDCTLDDISDIQDDASDDGAFDKTEAAALSSVRSESDCSDAIAEVSETQDTDDSLDGVSDGTLDEYSDNFDDEETFDTTEDIDVFTDKSYCRGEKSTKNVIYYETVVNTTPTDNFDNNTGQTSANVTPDGDSTQHVASVVQGHDPVVENAYGNGSNHDEDSRNKKGNQKFPCCTLQ